MREYNFEFTNHRLTIKLFGICFAVFVVLLIAMIVTIDLIGIIGSLALAFGTPLLIFLIFKKRIKNFGRGIIYPTHVEFGIYERLDSIRYEDISSYLVERYNGTQLKIKLRSGKKFNIQANSNFCEIDKFDAFSDDLDKVLQQFKEANKANFVRKKSMFERAWILPVLIILSVGLIGGAAFALFLEKPIPASFYTSAAITIPLWIAYLNARKRTKKVD